MCIRDSPSTIRRAYAIAQLAGIPAERVPELLAESHSSKGYPLPPQAAPEERVFSTMQKAAAAARLSWTLLFVMALTPAVVAWLVRQTGAVVPLRWLLYALGSGMTLLVWLAVLNLAPVKAYPNMARRLRARLEGDGSHLGGAVFVGLAPSDAPRVYEGFYDWDVGYLLLGGDRICYLGDGTSFCLSREAIQDIRLGPGPPGWLRSQRLYVTWRDPESSTRHTLNIRPADASSLLDICRRMEPFSRMLIEWWHGGAALPPADSDLPNLGPPGWGEVTSASPLSLIHI